MLPTFTSSPEGSSALISSVEATVVAAAAEKPMATNVARDEIK